MAVQDRHTQPGGIARIRSLQNLRPADLRRNKNPARYLRRFIVGNRLIPCQNRRAAVVVLRSSVTTAPPNRTNPTMKNKKQHDRTLASLQHLCSLGLPSETVMPDLLPGLSAWMAADNGQFIWLDVAQQPSHFYCHAGDAAFWQIFSARIDALSVSERSGMNMKWFLARNTPLAVGGSGDSLGYYRSSFYRKVMRYVGGECSMCIPIRDSAGMPRAQIGINRDRRSHPFDALEQQRYGQFASHLSLLFSQPSDSKAMTFERAAEGGMAVFDVAGRPLHSDDIARQLLFLSGHPQFVPAGNRSRNPDLDARIRQICGVLHDIANGVPAAAPAFSQTMPWGRFVFRAHRLSPLAGDEHLIGMDIARYIPRRIATWRQISKLDLPLRQRQVCLEFAENRSLSDIAALLGISRNTVIDHVNRIYSRYGLEPGRENLQEYLLRADGQSI